MPYAVSGWNRACCSEGHCGSSQPSNLPTQVHHKCCTRSSHSSTSPRVGVPDLHILHSRGLSGPILQYPELSLHGMERYRLLNSTPLERDFHATPFAWICFHSSAYRRFSQTIWVSPINPWNKDAQGWRSFEISQRRVLPSHRRPQPSLASLAHSRDVHSFPLDFKAEWKFSKWYISALWSHHRIVGSLYRRGVTNRFWVSLWTENAPSKGRNEWAVPRSCSNRLEPCEARTRRLSLCRRMSRATPSRPRTAQIVGSQYLSGWQPGSSIQSDNALLPEKVGMLLLVPNFYPLR